MYWEVEFYDDFYQEFQRFSEELQDILLTRAIVIKEFGPHLGRPYVDTLKGSEYANMKELRFETKDGVWRVAFAFDPDRKAILLVAGDKQGVNERKFYQDLVSKADTRFADHLKSLKSKPDL